MLVPQQRIEVLVRAAGVSFPGIRRPRDAGKNENGGSVFEDRGVVRILDQKRREKSTDHTMSVSLS